MTKEKAKSALPTGVHGEWVEVVFFNDKAIGAKCSVCGERIASYEKYGFKFCPNCGARMDGGR